MPVADGRACGLLDADAEVAMACRLRSETVPTSSVDLAAAGAHSLGRDVLLMPARAVFNALALAALGGTAIVVGLRRSRLWWLPLAPHAGFLLVHGVALATCSGAAGALGALGLATNRTRVSPLHPSPTTRARRPARPQPISATSP